MIEEDNRVSSLKQICYFTNWKPVLFPLVFNNRDLTIMAVFTPWKYSNYGYYPHFQTNIIMIIGLNAFFIPKWCECQVLQWLSFR